MFGPEIVVVIYQFSVSDKMTNIVASSKKVKLVSPIKNL